MGLVALRHVGSSRTRDRNRVPCIGRRILIICLFVCFLAALRLRCCEQAFSSCGERGLLFVAVRGLLIDVASLVAATRVLGAQAQ